MGIEVATALIASAVIGAAGSAYAADKQEDAQEDAQRAQERARQQAEEEARRVAMEQRPDEVAATMDVGGSTTVGKNQQSTADFLVPTQKALGSSKKGSGLGFKV